jgi:hypothetical protein
MLGNNKKNIGFDINYFTNKSDFSAAALLWKANIISNGGTIPDAKLQIFDTNFFIPATANGNILNQLDRLNIYCGLVGYPIAARTNIIKAAHYITPVSSPTFDNNGYKSAGTSYLDLNYNPSTQGVKLTQNSLTHFIGFKNPNYSAGNRRSMGAIGTSRLEVYLNDSGNRLSFNNAGAVSNISTPTSYVLVTGKRTAASGVGCNLTDVNGTQTLDNSASSANPNLNIFELATNLAGSPLGNFDDQYHLCSGHGSSNLDLSSLRTILNNTFIALGV